MKTTITKQHAKNFGESFGMFTVLFGCAMVFFPLIKLYAFILCKIGGLL